MTYSAVRRTHNSQMRTSHLSPDDCMPRGYDFTVCNVAKFIACAYILYDMSPAWLAFYACLALALLAVVAVNCTLDYLFNWLARLHDPRDHHAHVFDVSSLCGVEDASAVAAAAMLPVYDEKTL